VPKRGSTNWTCRYFLQSITIAARARGLETISQVPRLNLVDCRFRPAHRSQEAPAKYQLILRKHLPIGDSEIVALGMSMGYPGMFRKGPRQANHPESCPRFGESRTIFCETTEEGCLRYCRILWLLSTLHFLYVCKPNGYTSLYLLQPHAVLGAATLDHKYQQLLLEGKNLRERTEKVPL
jgi:hypothetical protein